MYFQGFIQFVLYTVILILVILGIYALISVNRKIKTAKHHKWRKQSVHTSLSPAGFVETVQQACFKNKWYLMEITASTATIRTLPSVLSWGIFFYIVYTEGNPNTVDVYARGALTKFSFYHPTQINLANHFFKV